MFGFKFCIFDVLGVVWEPNSAFYSSLGVVWVEKSGFITPYRLFGLKNLVYGP